MAFDLLNNSRRGKTENMTVQLGVSLREFYHGKTKRLAITKDVVCKDCKGRGTFDKGVQGGPCANCEGRGSVVTTRNIGEGMIQQLSSVCTVCNGDRLAPVPEAERCKTCQGKRVVPEKSVVEVVIQPGMPEGKRIVLSGFSHEAPDLEPGDLELVLQQKPGVDFVEQRFQRRGADLVVQETLNIAEALCGYKKYIQHLDGRWLLIESPPQTVTKAGDVHFIPNEGMPAFHSPGSRGHLIIEFAVALPAFEDLTADVREKLPRLFPPPPPPSAEEMIGEPHSYRAAVGSSTTSSGLDEQNEPSPSCATQ